MTTIRLQVAPASARPTRAARVWGSGLRRTVARARRVGAQAPPRAKTPAEEAQEVRETGATAFSAPTRALLPNCSPQPTATSGCTAPVEAADAAPGAPSSRRSARTRRPEAPPATRRLCVTRNRAPSTVASKPLAACSRAPSMRPANRVRRTAQRPAWRRMPGTPAPAAAAHRGALRCRTTGRGPRRHHPQVQAAALFQAHRLVGRIHGDRAVGLPVAHVPVVRDDARAGFQRQQRGAQLQVDLLQQVHGDHRGHRQIGLEQVLLDEACALGHAGLRGVLAAALDQLGHDLHAQPARAEAPRRQDDDAPVARAEVEHEILSRRPAPARASPA